jgi:type III pantothenate kinase
MKRQILVDIGNSQIKFASSESGLQTPIEDFEHAQEPSAQFSLDRFDDKPTAWYVASVNRAAFESLSNCIRQGRPQDQLTLLTHDMLPLEIEVDFPAQVGLDRLCAAVAATRLSPKGSAAIVVDSGTAVNIEAIRSDGVYEGGVIFPGIETNFKSLRFQTSALPEVRFDAGVLPSPIGKNTNAAITAGVLYANIGAIEQIVSRFQQELMEPTVVYVTGGFGKWIAEQHPEWSFHPLLVLDGVRITAEHLAAER